MKIGFFGTPELAAYCLERLSADHSVVFVVTCEDKPQGRCLNVCSSPVKDAAIAKGIPVLQPGNLKDPETLELFRNYNADIYVVVAYGCIIPRSIFAQPRLGTVNLHPSLLPRYRGAAPVQWALLSGETRSGVTVQLIDERLDAGDVVMQMPFDIHPDETTGDIYERILPESYSLLHDAIRALDAGTVRPIPQIEADATYCRKITRESARLDFTRTTLELHNQVRALNPKPGAWCEFRERTMKIWRTTIPHDEIAIPDLAPGALFRVGKRRIMVRTGDGVLEIVELQPETKKVLTALEFINGSRLDSGERFS